MPYYWEPVKWLVYIDVRDRLKEKLSEQELAELYADVSAKTSLLHHELNDPDYDHVHDTVEQSFWMWEEQEEELLGRILPLARPGMSEEELRSMGTFRAVMPFMERNGYRNGTGWWIRKDE